MGNKSTTSYDYDKDDIIGKGGFAKIFRGTLTKNGVTTKVAVKRILADNKDSASEQREFTIQTNFDHRNVVKLLHWDKWGTLHANDDFRFLILELCEASLDKAFLKEGDPKKYKGPLPSELQSLYHLTNGLEYIHSQKVVHRDIKPGNVLISLSPKEVLLKWSDFGFSKITSSDGNYSMSGWKGTSKYLAPEIIANENNINRTDQSHRILMTIMSDIFACGCVFFQFLTKGTHPFGYEYQATNNISISNPINLKELSSEHFAFEMIKSMLAKDPADRPTLTKIILNLNSHQKKIKEEFYRLSSLPSPNEKEAQSLIEIIEEDFEVLHHLVDENGRTPLLNLVCHESNNNRNLHRCIEALLLTPKRTFPETESSVDVNHQDSSGFNALHNLCMNYQGDDFTEIIQLLITGGIDVNKTDQESDHNALQLLFKKNSNNQKDLVNIVNKLIESGININQPSSRKGWTALHYLCRHYKHENLIDLATLLINKEVDVKAKTSDGWTAFHILCQKYTHNNIAEIIRLLISNGVEINAKTTSKGLTALHILCQNYTQHVNLSELIKLMIENGADINATTSKGWTVLHIICRLYKQDNLIDIIQLIADKGGNIDARAPGGLNSPLHFVCEYYPYDNLINLVRLLIEMGDQASAKTLNGFTALDLLIRFYTHENLSELVAFLSQQEDVDIGTKHVMQYPRITFMYLNQCLSKAAERFKTGIILAICYISPTLAWSLVTILRPAPVRSTRARRTVINQQ